MQRLRKRLDPLLSGLAQIGTGDASTDLEIVLFKRERHVMIVTVSHLEGGFSLHAAGVTLGIVVAPQVLSYTPVSNEDLALKVAETICGLLADILTTMGAAAYLDSAGRLRYEWQDPTDSEFEQMAPLMREMAQADPTFLPAAFRDVNTAYIALDTRLGDRAARRGRFEDDGDITII